MRLAVAGVVFWLVVAGCASAKPSLELTGIGIAGRMLCVDKATGAVYLRPTCNGPNGGTR